MALAYILNKSTPCRDAQEPRGALPLAVGLSRGARVETDNHNIVEPMSVRID